MSVDALLLVVTEDHWLHLLLRGGDVSNLLVLVALGVDLLLGSELLHAIAIDLELIMAEASLILSGILVLRHD